MEMWLLVALVACSFFLERCGYHVGDGPLRLPLGLGGLWCLAQSRLGRSQTTGSVGWNHQQAINARSWGSNSEVKLKVGLFTISWLFSHVVVELNLWFSPEVSKGRGLGRGIFNFGETCLKFTYISISDIGIFWLDLGMLPPLWFVLLEALVLRCRCLHLGFGTIHQVRNQAQTRKLQEPAATVKENDDGHKVSWRFLS